MFETAIKDVLLGNATIAGIVGAAGVQPVAMSADSSPPYLTYRITTDRSASDTLSDGPSDYRKAAFELDVYAMNYGDCAELSRLAQGAFDGYSGVVSGVELDTLLDEEANDIEELVPEGESTPVYRRSVGVNALYRIVGS